jgi:DNA replication protein DnaC
MSEETCPLCNGTGWKIVERAGLSGAARCGCSEAKIARVNKENSGIPPNYQDASLDNFEIPEDNPIARRGLATVLMQVRSFVREFPHGDKQGLLLVGDPGSGKTHLAAAALNALVSRGHEGVFFDYQNLLDRIRKGWDVTGGTTEKEAYQFALDVEILVIDDLAAQRSIDWVQDIITSIVTYRCNNRKALIATTNVADEVITEETGTSAPVRTSLSEKATSRLMLTDVLGSRARSRLFEMCRIVRMPAVEDYRVRHKQIK